LRSSTHGLMISPRMRSAAAHKCPVQKYCLCSLWKVSYNPYARNY